ncbi:MAG: hypothetical protein AB7O28_15515 [Vicinamibacterales bacterium]
MAPTATPAAPARDLRAGSPVLSAVRQRLMPVSALVNVLGLSGLVSVVVAVWVLFGLDGWAYYTTPFGVRGYSPAHRLLRPSGPVGQTLGVFGAVLMLVPFAYMGYKRLWRSRTGTNLKRLLEVHIFCGIVGPVLITFHTAFKFNGIVSAAYWSMALVALSGFVGRYLYVRIPRTIRGVELSQTELDERMTALREELQWSAGPDVLEALDRLEAEVDARPASWFSGLGEGALRRSLADLASQLESRTGAGSSAELRAAVEERLRLSQRRHALAATKRLFDLWHVFHLPLVWVMFAIVSLHVGVALYLGYVPFRW